MVQLDYFFGRGFGHVAFGDRLRKDGAIILSISFTGYLLGKIMMKVL